MRTYWFLLPYLALSSTLSAQPMPGNFSATYPDGLNPAFSEVAYAAISKSQVLDLFLPEGNGPFPLVLNIHASSHARTSTGL